MERVMQLASKRAVVVFTLSSCCMCHTVTQLMADLSVNALVHELDRDPGPQGKGHGARPAVFIGGRGPAVFIGGKLVGGTNSVMSLHLAGELVPMLMNAGALWV